MDNKQRPFFESPLANLSIRYNRIVVSLGAISLFASTGMFLIFFLPQPGADNALSWVTGTIALFSLASVYFSSRFRENYQIASILLFPGIITTIIVLILRFSLSNISAISLMFISIPMASILLGRNGNLLATFQLIIIAIATHIFGQTGLYNIPSSDLDDIVVLSITLMMESAILNFGLANIKEMIGRADNARQAAEAQNLELQQVQENLVKEVEERTAILARRARYLEAAADVGQAATSIYSLEELLPQVTEFVSERFGFYHVGIFLNDSINEYAELKAANSPGGRRMLSRNHKLKIGSEGIVGFVTNTGQARIALDTGADAFHFNTPELPATRSEMALPMYAGGRLIGALDVQSMEANAFSEGDIAALRVLADQVSMAISNAQLFEQLQESLESERRAYGEISRTAWQELVSKRPNWGYQFIRNRTLPVQGNWSEDMIEAANSEQVVQTMIEDTPTLMIPLAVGGDTIGVIRLKKTSGAPPWSQEEIDLTQSLSDRLIQALDSARLYQDTQRRAIQENLTTEVSSNIRQSLDIDAVLRTAAKEIGQTFNAQEVVIRMNPDEN